jgi:hypothetical protein
MFKTASYLRIFVKKNKKYKKYKIIKIRYLGETSCTHELKSNGFCSKTRYPKKKDSLQSCGREGERFHRANAVPVV